MHSTPKAASFNRDCLVTKRGHREYSSVGKEIKDRIVQFRGSINSRYEYSSVRKSKYYLVEETGGWEFPDRKQARRETQVFSRGEVETYFIQVETR
jgi:hypothetical protein